MTQRTPSPRLAAAQPFADGVPVGSDHSVFSLTASPGLPTWLARHDVSLLLTTYQAGRLFAIGRSTDGGLSVFQRTMERCMGLWASPDQDEFWVATAWQLWRLANALQPGATHDGYDRVYVPRTGHTTGNLDIHDITVDEDGHPVFVNTSFSCVARLSRAMSFAPIWAPPFISALAPEDRCHLNGMAMVDGRPRFVTAVARTDTAEGWRAHRADGGLVIDITTNEVVASELSMPHSPRWHNKRLWLLNAGSGEFGYLDPTTGAFVAVTFLPGFARGLCFVGNHALVGISAARREAAFAGLRLDDELTRRRAEAVCGIAIIDLSTGAITEWLRLDGAVRELYDVAVMPGAVRPMVLGFVTDEIHHLLSIEI